MDDFDFYFFWILTEHNYKKKCLQVTKQNNRTFIPIFIYREALRHITISICK